MLKIIKKLSFIPLALAVINLLFLSPANLLFAVDDPVFASQRAECLKNTAMEWSPFLNRCIGKQQAREVRHEAQACAKLTDVKQREECHKNLATKLTGVASNPDGIDSKTGYGKSMLMNGINTAYGALTLINSFTAKSSSKTCTSKIIFGVTAAAGIATDFLMKSKAKQKAEELKKKFSIDLKMTAHNSQMKAFQYLKDEQKMIEEVAGEEKKRNLLLMLGYGAATGMALYEILNPTTYAACNKKEGSSEQPKTETQSTEATQAAKPDTPQTGDPAQGASSAAATSGISLGGIGSFFSSSKGVAVLAGISTIFSGILYKAADGQEAEAKENQKKIDAIIASFKDSFLAFCPNGRESLDDPQCYCYTDDGKENPDRTRSQICQDLWAKNKYKLSALAGNYQGVSKFANPVGCIDTFGNFDENCNCRKFVDSKGVNSCKKGQNLKIDDTNFGSAFTRNSGIQDVMKFANNSFSGDPNFNSFNTGSLLKKAIAARKFNDLIAANLKDKNGRIEGMPNLDENNVISYAKAAFGENTIAKAESRFKSPFATLTGNNISDPTLKTAVGEAINKAGLQMTGGAGAFSKKTANKENFNFNLGGGETGNAGNVLNLPETVEQKTYRIKSDVSKDDGSSIFEIISNRYVVSGLRRLFEN